MRPLVIRVRIPRWLGPGRPQTVIIGSVGTPDLLVHYACDITMGKPSLQITTIAWQNGWPEAALSK